MRVYRDIVLAALVLIVAAALMGMASAEQRPSRVVYPEQYLPVQFSHAQHLAEAQMSCDACHKSVRTSASSLDNNLPLESECMACHAIDRSQPHRVVDGPTAECVRCHPSYIPTQRGVERTVLPIPNLKFSHKAHLERGTSCETCHGDLTKIEKASAHQLPTMRTCQGCHDGKRADDSCVACHLAQAGGIVQSDFPGVGQLVPSGSLRGAAHDMEFRTGHKYAAQNDQAFCASCHKKDFCSGCHNGVTKPMDFHAGDYVRMHAVEARRNSPDCSSCHRLQTFCQGCHSRMGVAADEKGSQFPGAGRYHPPGWSVEGLAGRGPDHHSFEAQRNIKQCASCHRENFCTRCHSAEVGTPRANPHPRDWLGSRRCKALVKRNKRMCLRCHIQSNIDC